jgi:ubiquitin carboxyl-terminal hydrolase 47
MLNVNDFVSNSDSATTFPAPPQQNGTSDTASIGQESGIENNSVTKCDDCSTTDSGSALEEDSCNGGTSIPSSGTNDQDLQDDDEGIDMGGGDAATKNGNSSGPYCYDLFAIMIHSGSASGGHYYAYIKDFETNKWYSFNDQTVSNITQEDIQKSFGGSSTKNYYSSAYSSSTNAYMLMYRQSDPQRNTLPIKEDDFPAHIKVSEDEIETENKRLINLNFRHSS